MSNKLLSLSLTTSVLGVGSITNSFLTDLQDKLLPSVAYFSVFCCSFTPSFTVAKLSRGSPVQMSPCAKMPHLHSAANQKGYVGFRLQHFGLLLNRKGHRLLSNKQLSLLLTTSVLGVRSITNSFSTDLQDKLFQVMRIFLYFAAHLLLFLTVAELSCGAEPECK